MCEMRESEAIAKRVFETMFPGAEMCFYGDQSHAECDFDLWYADGTRAAVEVTSITDGDWKRTVDNLYGKKKGEPVVEAKKCTKSWVISLNKNAHVPEIRKQVDDLLSEIEGTWPDLAEHCDLHDLRWEYFNNSIPDSLSNPRWSQSQLDTARRIFGDSGWLGYSGELGRLGISGGGVLSGWPPPPKIILSGPEDGGAFGVTTATSAAEAEAQKEDNRRKLAASGTQERHLAAWVDESRSDVWTVLMKSETFQPPDTCPNLPPEITRLWVIAPVERKGFIVWYGSKTQKWQSVLVSECNRNVVE